MNDDTAFNLHNESDTQLKGSDGIKKMCQQARCLQCTTIIQKVRSLLHEMTEIKNNEVIGVCEHCKRLNPSGNCKTCKYLVNKFVCSKSTLQQNQEARLKSWLYKAEDFLQSIQKCKIMCRNRLCQESTSIDELENLLQDLGSSFTKHDPGINVNPKTKLEQFVCKEFEIQNKKVMEELVLKTESEIKKKINSNDSLYVNLSKLKKRKSKKILEQGKVKGDNKKSDTNVTQVVSDKDKKTTRTVTEKETQTKTIHRKLKQNIKDLKEKEMKKENRGNNVQAPLTQLPSKNQDNAKNVKMEKLESENTESVVECEQLVRSPSKMIKGAFLVRFDPHYKDVLPVPQSYHVEAVCENQENVMRAGDKTKKPKKTQLGDEETDNKKNKIRRGFLYELSNPAFIENGWTILPKTEVMKKIHIFKMEPACPRFNWFERNKHKKVMYYDSGEKLAEISDDGHGQWFYKNGEVALDFYNTKDLNEGQRYVVFSSGDNVDKGKTSLRTVLASFDYSGNGVVYDKYGNERLKYNQYEGILHDEKVGPPSHWQWHSLYVQPVLQTVCKANIVSFLDTSSLKQNKNKSYDQFVAKEYAKFVKQSTEKGSPKFKRFQIRMKVLKINDQFSLRVLDQANVYLLFRDGQISLKLNLGMILIKTEIVGTEIGEVSDVVTPYDQFPPQSQSVADIQKTLRKVRRNARVHGHVQRNRRF